MASIVEFLLLLSPLVLLSALLPLARCAQTPQPSDVVARSAAPELLHNETADLTRLINETLALNNKTLARPDQAAAAAFKDDWTFERAEYDLMEFLQDLGARYQLKQDSPSAGSLDEPGNFEARRDTTEAPRAKTTSSSDELTTLTASIAASTTEISTSLASEDHDIAESKWQYGIFDRFTRTRSASTSTTTTKDLFADTQERFDVRQFNSDECGLRTYDDRDRVYLSKADELESFAGEASKDLSQRRQRPAAALSVLAQKRHQFQTVVSDLMGDKSEGSSSSSVNNWANKFEKDAYDSYKQQQPHNQVNLPSLADRIPNLSGGGGGAPGSANSESADTEFNLASRRHWLQQQLGNTLHLLGFNGSAQSVAEFLNQTSGLSLSTRENMMKKKSNNMNKVAKLLAPSEPSAKEQQQQLLEQQHHHQQHGAETTHGTNTDQQQQQQQKQSGLSARQDELKLEARVIGGSDARL